MYTIKNFLKWLLIIVLGFYILIFAAHFLLDTSPSISELKSCNFDGFEMSNGNGGVYITGPYGKCLSDIGGCDYGDSEKFGGCCDEDNYACEECGGNYYDCSDFDDQESAQSIYYICEDFLDYTNDIHRLDEDGDGIACESLLPVED
jgi:hypothetical protein